MEDYFYLNPSKMMEISKKLGGSEIKMLYAMFYCMACDDRSVFINNAENRKRMAEELDFSKTPERISSILSSLTKKGVIKREMNGVYTVPGDLFRLGDKSIVISQ